MCVNMVSHDIFYIISFGIPVIFPIDWYPKVNHTRNMIHKMADFLVVASKEQMSLLQGKLVEGGAERQQLEWL